MNILFCTTSRVSEQKGGTERITARLSYGLRQKGYKIFSAYKAEINSDFPINPCDGEINVTKASLFDYIKMNHIDVIIMQKMTRDIVKIRRFITENHLNCKIVSVLHFSPGYEEKALRFKTFYNELKKGQSQKENIKNVLRVFGYPLYKILYPLRNRQLYRTVYQYSDKTVLLSKSFLTEYRNYASLKDIDRLTIIPNALSYDQFLSLDDISIKKKQVLIVARLNETQKRLSIALKVWRIIENHIQFKDWNLKIVGHGNDTGFYKKLVSQLNLERVEFCGRQNPLTYYKQSRIFIMTSAYEGWGLTLTEAQQFGCVPIAIRSFSSLSDIISNGINGIILESTSITKYADALMHLMNDENLQSSMAQNAILQSAKFELNSIVDLWEKIILEK